ncbi:OmpA family protein [Magnetospirillum sulfuroxidans]|uniref:OmpA family protein n=1 Tax=Magnetospirillum sulfuroxidans TaxID=611300 RepID=A0ABS5I9Y7_9PROT|nr:OmpA family protein [Magnetospirillum sulfuroxidans]MBR9971086.1 OmpA family protein [Magnetospirillum sulfuroxidans]
MKALKLIPILALGVFLTACESLKPNVVVVLPEQNGHVGAVVVTPAVGGSATVLDKPYAAVHADAGGKPEAVAMDQAKVDKVFGQVLAARPIPPKSFLLYFQEGSDELTAESKPIFEQVFAEIARRPAADMVVIGHTDRVGNLLDNDNLALKRAGSMRDALVRRGVAADVIAIAGRGEREPLVATADGIAESRNRRVEISVR